MDQRCAGCGQPYTPRGRGRYCRACYRASRRANALRASRTVVAWDDQGRPLTDRNGERRYRNWQRPVTGDPFSDDGTPLTGTQVGAIFGVTARCVTMWADNGRINATRTKGGHRRYEPAEVLRFIQENGGRDPQTGHNSGSRYCQPGCTCRKHLMSGQPGVQCAPECHCHKHANTRNLPWNKTPAPGAVTAAPQRNWAQAYEPVMPLPEAVRIVNEMYGTPSAQSPAWRSATDPRAVRFRAFLASRHPEETTQPANPKPMSWAEVYGTKKKDSESLPFFTPYKPGETP